MKSLNSGLRFAVVAAAVMMLAACSSTSDDTGASTSAAPATTSEPTSSIVPGSAEDFEQNVGNRVYFDLNQSTLTDEARATLQKQAAWLKTYPSVALTVEGNCDERGTREYNLALGARRANAAKSYLVGLGVEASRLTTISYGKERPIDPASNEEAWAKNRNATSVISGGASS
ncbi:MAG: peptidoglycan-associated lipoprotein Pal [Parvibaculaceae bacterium]|nr:peptidoglycan-associated lipoprotein Pal [Parvibaculaceae bacterium]